MGDQAVGSGVEAELRFLPKDMQARFLHVAARLETFGPGQMGMSHVGPLRAKLREMRLSGRAGIGRCIYTAAPGRRLVVLHVFVKKTQRTPRSAIETALRRMKEID